METWGCSQSQKLTWTSETGGISLISCMALDCASTAAWNTEPEGFHIKGLQGTALNPFPQPQKKGKQQDFYWTFIE